MMPGLNGLVVGTITGGEQKNFCEVTQNHEVKMTLPSWFSKMLSDWKTYIYSEHDALF